MKKILKSLVLGIKAIANTDNISFLHQFDYLLKAIHTLMMSKYDGAKDSWTGSQNGQAVLWDRTDLITEKKKSKIAKIITNRINKNYTPVYSKWPKISTAGRKGTHLRMGNFYIHDCFSNYIITNLSYTVHFISKYT